MFTNVTLLYFLLLIPLSGFIAWLGDRIGHKSGKRRHTLFGLRPRHTAMLFTVGTGMCISLVSFLLMYGLNGTFRMIVSDGFRLYETNRDLKHSNVALTQGNANLTRVASQREQEAEAADRNRVEALASEKKADAAAKIAVDAEKKAIAEQRKAEAEAGKALGLLAAEKQSLQKAQGNLLMIKASLQDRSASLRDSQNRVAKAQKAVQDASARVKTAQRDAADAQGNVDRIRRIATEAYDNQAKTLAEQNRLLAALQKQYDDQAKLFNDQKAATDQQSQKLAALNTQVAEGQSRLRQIQVNTEALREHRITYQVGEEVDRIAIKPGYNVWRLEAILGSFVSTAAKKAELRGARKDKSGERALVVLPQDADSTGANGIAVNTSIAKSRQRIPTADERMDDTISAAASSIRTTNTDVVVLVSAVANAVAGEPVAVSLKLYKNPIVFPADTQIGDAHINGKGSPEEIADALYTFLRQDVRPTLLHAGVIPVSPGGSESDTAPTLVNLSGDDWLHIMDRIRLAGDNARVVVTASHDMRAGDLPVPLHFDVKGVPSGVFRAPSTW